LRIAEDYDLILRLLHLGMKFRIYTFRLYFYRKHSASVSHRLGENVLHNIIAANLRFYNHASPCDSRLIAVLEARMRSLETALAYGNLLNALKSRDWFGALSIVGARPQAISPIKMFDPEFNARAPLRPSRCGSWRTPS
jgi:hypothetical protein